MSVWFGGSPSPGDWVKVRSGCTVRSSFTDYLTDGGIAAGTLGAVVDRTGSRLVVEFDGGLSGRVTVRGVPATDVVVYRRGGGTGAFAARTNRLLIVRLSLALVLLAPMLQFAATYLWQMHTTKGMVAAFVEAAVLGTGDQLVAFLHDPVKTIIYFAICAGMSKIAFGRG